MSRNLCAWLAVVWVSLACGSLQAGERLRLMAFNVECLAAPGTRVNLERYRWDEARTEHLERVANVIESLNPDVVNLEEVTSAAALEALVKILHDKGLTAYGGYHVESADRFTGFDVCLLSKIQPDEIEGKRIRLVYSYSGDENWREKYSFVDSAGKTQERTTSISRNALYYLTVGKHKLGFLGLHLKSNPDDAASNAQRTAESHIAQKILRQEITARGYTPIVLGDLNDYDPDVPDRDDTRSTVTKVLANLKDFDPEQAGPEMFNAAEKIPRMADRYTSHWDRNENLTADSYDVMTMIDHVLLHRSLQPALRRAFISHVSDLRTSDHYPVVVDLELP